MQSRSFAVRVLLSYSSAILGDSIAALICSGLRLRSPLRLYSFPMQIRPHHRCPSPMRLCAIPFHCRSFPCWSLAYPFFSSPRPFYAIPSPLRPMHIHRHSIPRKAAATSTRLCAMPCPGNADPSLCSTYLITAANHARADSLPFVSMQIHCHSKQYNSIADQTGLCNAAAF